MLAQDGVAPAAQAVALSTTDLAPIIQAAVARWSAAGAPADALAAIAKADFIVTDLPNAQLGRDQGEIVYLDRTTAGHGWFIDPTPAVELHEACPPGHQVLAADFLDRAVAAELFPAIQGAGVLGDRLRRPPHQEPRPEVGREPLADREFRGTVHCAGPSRWGVEVANGFDPSRRIGRVNRRAKKGSRCRGLRWAECPAFPTPNPHEFGRLPRVLPQRGVVENLSTTFFRVARGLWHRGQSPMSFGRPRARAQLFSTARPVFFGQVLGQYPLGESNPCSRTENPMSWATRRRGQQTSKLHIGRSLGVASS